MEVSLLSSYLAYPREGHLDRLTYAKEAMPADMPKPLGKDINLRMLVDSDHAER